MTNEYYPLSQVICHHFYNNHGCTFCGYYSQKRTVSQKELTPGEMIQHFDSFVGKNIEDILKSDRLIIAPNGSWFTEVPQQLRKHIYDFIKNNKISLLKYESRASLFDLKKALLGLSIMHHSRGYDTETTFSLVQKAIENLSEALNEIKPNHMVSFGLEVADDNDLKILNKGCSLDDYTNASNKVHDMGAKVCANILLVPPRIENPLYKAFITAQFGAEKMGASEFLIMPCSPMNGTEAYEDWINARWNPVSATAASEVFRIIREKYPQIKVRYSDLRIFTKHGRHGKFKRKPGKWSEEEKQKVREEVRVIAEQVF